MTRRTKIIIGIAAVVVLLLILTHASFHWTREESSETSIYTSSNHSPSGDRLRTPAKIAIITPPAWQGAALQRIIAEKLRDDLEKKLTVYDVRRGAHGWSGNSPKVTIFSSKAEAEKAKTDFWVTVTPKEWSYSWWPLSRSYTAKVAIDCAPPGMSILRASWTDANSQFGALCMGLEYEQQGKITGIFSTSYLTSKVAESMAKSAAEQLQKASAELFDEFMKPKDKKD